MAGHGLAGPAAPLRGRRSERGVLDRLADAVRGGQSRVLVLYGEPGVGKTMLLDYLGSKAKDCRVVRAAGVQSEMELAFAGLHQLCAPMLDRLDRLPEPQQEALQTAFGRSADRYRTGSWSAWPCSACCPRWPGSAAGLRDRRPAVAGPGLGPGVRLRGAAAGRTRSAWSSAPGARRGAGGLPELPVAGLRDDDARALLGSALPGPLDTRVRDRSWPRRGATRWPCSNCRGGWRGDLAGGFGLPGAVSLSGRIEESFRRQLDALPVQTRRLLLLAAADPSGDPALAWRAAGRLGIPFQAAAPAAEAGLAEFGTRVRFRHPLLRSATYRSATAEDRQAVHLALAEATDPVADPDRRAWHRAQAAPGPDEEVAAEVERSAGRALSRGGLAAAAAFLERAVRLTVDPVRRVERTLAAAQVSLEAGEFGPALALLVSAEDGGGFGTGPLDEFASARVDLLRGQVMFISGQGGDAPPLLLKAAKRLEPLDPDLARETYLTAWMAAMFAGRLAGAGDLLEVSRAARALPAPTEPPRPVNLVLDGLTLLVTDGPRAAAPTLRQAVSGYVGADIAVADELRWGWLAQAAASALWDDDAWRAMLTRQVRLARDAGALDQLPILLGALGTAVVWSGDFAEAGALIAEAEAVCAATGTRSVPFTAMMLAAFRGEAAEAAPLVEATVADATAAGQGIAAAYARWVAAILGNGLGRYAEAQAAARQAAEDTSTVFISMWALPELIEAAVRSGEDAIARTALTRLADFTQAGQTDFGLGIEARSRALVSSGQAAETLYQDAITRLGRTRLRTELGRAHLLYGEWLRRENRRTDAREQLRAAHELLSAIGAAAFAGRAQHELAATGESVRKRTAASPSELTAQEASIARLAVEGRTNPEIGAQLFLSARTVEWHLRKVFAKLGITSRRELRAALSAAP